MEPLSPTSKAWVWLLIAWMLSLTAVLGSLFFGEVMKFPPCVLCWYQRVAMFPLVAIFTVGILSRDGRVYRYAWPLLTIGLALAVYHNLLYYGVIPEGISPCTQGVPCTSRQFEGFGFLTIPLLSLLAFLTIAASTFRFQSLSRSKK